MRRRYSWLLITTIVLLSTTDITLPIEKKKTDPKPNKEQAEQLKRKSPKFTKSVSKDNKARSKRRNVFQGLLRLIFQPYPKKQLGLRNVAVSSLCSITPEDWESINNSRESNIDTLVWSDYPFFIWRGQEKFKRFELLIDNEVVWKHPLKNNQTSLKYTGPPLKPRQEYSWKIIGYNYSNNKDEFYSLGLRHFKTMSAKQRAEIDEDLKAGINNLPGADKALQRAIYFSEKSMTSDVLTALYQVEDSPKQFWRALSDLEDEFAYYKCNGL